MEAIILSLISVPLKDVLELHFGPVLILLILLVIVELFIIWGQLRRTNQEAGILKVKVEQQERNITDLGDRVDHLIRIHIKEEKDD